MFEAIFLLPYIINTVAEGIIFQILLDPNYGIVNFALKFMQLQPINFLTDPDTALPTLIVFGIWSSTSFNIIILTTGLRTINQQYYFMADIYGATYKEKFVNITLPHLIPLTTFLVVINCVSSLKIYTEVYSIFNGKAGVGSSANTAIFYIYDKFYITNRYGEGMAATVILFVIILFFTLIQYLFFQKIIKR